MHKNNIIIDNIKLSYYVIGSGKPILFLHGGKLRALSFKKALKTLGKSHKVIAPDIPGYGESSTPRNYWSFQDYAHFFMKFLNEAKIKDVTLIGYSMGGGIAYHLAALSPKIKKLILIDSAGIEQTDESDLYKDMHRLSFYILHPQYILTFFTLFSEYLRFISKHIKKLDHIKKMRATMNESSRYEKFISPPTIILWAKHDEFFPISIARKLKEVIKGSSLIAVEGTHDWPFYKNKEFISLLNTYVNNPI